MKMKLLIQINPPTIRFASHRNVAGVTHEIKSSKENIGEIVIYKTCLA